jgi:hypothetical protein
MMQTEFALLIDGEFQEIRYYEERPSNLPQKLVTWHDVMREYGEPFEGLVGDVWVIRTADPATLPPSVPESVTRRQAALELHALQYITLQEALYMVKTAGVPLVIAAIFDTLVSDGSWTVEQRTLAEIDFAADNYYRTNNLLALMGLTSEQIDQFFISASTR